MKIKKKYLLELRNKENKKGQIIGKKRKVYYSIRNIISRKDDSEIENLTNALIKNLHKDKDPYLRQCGNALQSIRNYWFMKCELLEQKNFDDWIKQSDELHIEKEKKYLYKKTIEELNIKYKPFYKVWNDIYVKNKGRIIYFKSTVDEFGISILWSKDLNKNIHSLTKEEKFYLFKNEEFNITRFSSFLVLIFRYKNDPDFPIKVDLNNLEEIKKVYIKFNDSYRKTKK